MGLGPVPGKHIQTPPLRIGHLTSSIIEEIMQACILDTQIDSAYRYMHLQSYVKQFLRVRANFYLNGRWSCFQIFFEVSV